MKTITIYICTNLDMQLKSARTTTPCKSTRRAQTGKKKKIDHCFRSLFDLLHEGSLIKEKVNIIQSLELNTFNRYAHENNKGLPQTQKTI